MTDQNNDQLGVLFVCLGNICRSTMAEAVFKDIAHEKGFHNRWFVDSAGTSSYNIGCPPDERTLTVLGKFKINNYRHVARQVKPEDFQKYDFILGMDKENIKKLNSMKPKNCKAKVELFGSYDPEGGDIIEDPYYERGMDAFINVYKQCRRASIAFINKYTVV
ncbi:low molecular weight phosphotyrosine protein phosphatase-like [Adelges cooleyi]|uniref:low molecular weight phosphotyrosine protein phosphatase-like n=1 Tax=Adelges cooleyi TaxID=133065 RepID=UPI00217FA689|nr:low molecular weight phosphotyrosine protein phosphatase-like [Adelges cooleyi]